MLGGVAAVRGVRELSYGVEHDDRGTVEVQLDRDGANYGVDKYVGS